MSDNYQEGCRELVEKTGGTFIPVIPDPTLFLIMKQKVPMGIAVYPGGTAFPSDLVQAFADRMREDGASFTVSAVKIPR